MNIYRILVLLSLCITTSTLSLEAQCVNVNKSTTPGTGSIGFTSTGIDVGAIGDATGWWNKECSDLSTFKQRPELVSGSGGDLTIKVVRVPGVSTNAEGSCGEYKASTAEIRIWDYQKLGLLPCTGDRLEKVLAHEMGHVLGLGDVGCSGYAMGPGLYSLESPHSNECSKVDEVWDSDDEEALKEPVTCVVCVPAQEEEAPEDCVSCSPIILDLDGQGLQTTSIEEGVVFDIDGDGVAEKVSWTDPNGSEAFLWFDRNRNGSVDSGLELFGSATPLPGGGVSEDGFVALRAYDSPEAGGNGNGYLDRDDRLWAHLWTWIDTNHDGVSDQGEIMPLRSSQVTRLLTRHYRVEVDEHGNLHAVGHAEHRVKGRTELIRMNDVFFQRGE